MTFPPFRNVCSAEVVLQRPPSPLPRLPPPPPRRPMPGYKQRAARAAQPGNHNAASSAGPTESSLAHFLLEEWSWGFMSAVTVQKIAKAAKDDGLQHADIDALAALGSSGKHSRNCHPELLRKLPPSPLAPETLLFTLPMKTGSLGFRMVEQTMILPHVWFSMMYNHFPGAFRERVIGPEGAVEAFWEAAIDHPMFAGHGILQRRGFRSSAVPLSLHGDGVPVAGVGKAAGGYRSQRSSPPPPPRTPRLKREHQPSDTYPAQPRLVTLESP